MSKTDGEWSIAPAVGMRHVNDEEQEARVALFENVNPTQSTMVSANSNPNSKKFLYIAACTGNLASFFCGTALGWTSPEIPKLKGTDDNPLDSPLTTSQEGWIGSFLPLAAAIGPFAAGYMAEKFGRKKTLLISALPFIAAFILNVFSTNIYCFYAARLLCGVGTGIVFTIMPMYIAEISDDANRGTTGSLMQLFIVIGLLFSFALGPYLSLKLFNIILVVVPVIFLVTFFMFIPESPFFLVLNNKLDGAEEALMKLRAKTKDQVQKELETIRFEVDEMQQNKANFFDIFKSKGLRMAFILSCGLLTFQQLSGINVVLFYAQDIFSDAGVSLKPEICTIMIGVVQIFGSSVAPILVDKQGKRILLMLSGVGMALSLGVLAYFFYLKNNTDTNISSIGWLPIVCLMVYIFTYCFGFGSLPWAVMGELFPGNIKSIASTVSASGCWFECFLLTNYFGIIADLIGKAISFGFFSVCCVIATLFVYKLLPETTGKSLQEIQDILSGNSKDDKA